MTALADSTAIAREWKDKLGKPDVVSRLLVCRRENEPSQTAIHMHAHEDETLYVLEGERHAIICGTAYAVKAGMSTFLPHGVPHQLMHASGGLAHYLLLCNPGRFERFLAEEGQIEVDKKRVEAPSLSDLERLKEETPRFGISLQSSTSLLRVIAARFGFSIRE